MWNSFKWWLRNKLNPYNPWMRAVNEFSGKMGSVKYGTNLSKAIEGKIVRIDCHGSSVVVNAHKKKFYICAPFTVTVDNAAKEAPVKIEDESKGVTEVA